MPTVSFENTLAFVHLHNTNTDLDDPADTQISLSWLSEMEDICDTLEKRCATPAADLAVIFTGRGKFFCVGLDTANFMKEQEEVDAYLKRFQKILYRLSVLGAPTLSMINGHAYGAGAMLALCAEQRIMRSDRGYFCLPEVTLGVGFPRGMFAFMSHVVPRNTLREIMLTGKNLSSNDCYRLHLVDKEQTYEDLFATGTQMVSSLAHLAGPKLASLKQQIFAPIAEIITDPSTYENTQTGQ